MMAPSKHLPRESSSLEEKAQASDEESMPFLPGSPNLNECPLVKSGKRTVVILVLACAASLAVGLAGGMLINQDRHLNSAHTALLRDTDFGPSKPFIKSESVTFTGSPMFMENGTFAVPNPGPIRYVGKPSGEVDEAWDHLTRGRYFRITKEEAIDAFGEAKDEYWNDAVGGYMAGLDVFHALHCLNQLRMAVWSDYYPAMHQVAGSKLIHREHCIDHIRQMLMCGGDMTLVPTVWTDVLQRNYVHSDVAHSCRDFGRLRDFIALRGSHGTEQTPESDLKKHQ